MISYYKKMDRIPEAFSIPQVLQIPKKSENDLIRVSFWICEITGALTELKNPINSVVKRLREMKLHTMLRRSLYHLAGHPAFQCKRKYRICSQ